MISRAASYAVIATSRFAEGYDPTLGIMHEGREGSSAFVFDMMEPERPKVDRSILAFV
jgi:CRISP-associated protein Cas1